MSSLRVGTGQLSRLLLSTVTSRLGQVPSAAQHNIFERHSTPALHLLASIAIYQSCLIRSRVGCIDPPRESRVSVAQLF